MLTCEAHGGHSLTATAATLRGMSSFEGSRIDHLNLPVVDLARSVAFHTAVLAPLGIELEVDVIVLTVARSSMQPAQVEVVLVPGVRLGTATLVPVT